MIEKKMKLTLMEGRKWPNSSFNLFDANFPFDLKVKGFFFLVGTDEPNWAERSEVKVVQSCLTLCDPMDYTLHGIL